MLALDLIDPPAYRLAGEEAGEVAGQSAGGPEVVGLGQQAHAGQVQLAIARQGFAPAPWHVGNGLGGASEGAVQGVFGAAVDDPLGFHALSAAEAGAFHQHGGKTQALQASVEPETGDACADNQHIGGNSGWHAATSVSKTKPQVSSLRPQAASLALTLAV